MILRFNALEYTSAAYTIPSSFSVIKEKYSLSMSLMMIFPAYFLGLPLFPVGGSLQRYLRSASSLSLLTKCIPDDITLSTKDFLENQASATRYLERDVNVSFLS